MEAAAKRDGIKIWEGYSEAAAEEEVCIYIYIYIDIDMEAAAKRDGIKIWQGYSEVAAEEEVRSGRTRQGGLYIYI